MDKKDLSRVLREIGIALELTEDNPFRARAYLNAARLIDNSSYSFSELLDEGKAKGIKGLGNAILERLDEYKLYGQIEMHQELLAQLPKGLWEVLEVPGLGTKRVRSLHELLGISNLGELEYACHENRLVNLKGFGSKMQQNILNGLSTVKARRGQALLSEALPIASRLLEQVRQVSGVGQAEVAGEARRCCPIVKEVSLVVASAQPTSCLSEISASLAEYVSWEIAESDRLRGKLPNGLSVAVRGCLAENFAYTWLEETGDSQHFAALVQHGGTAIASCRLAQSESEIYACVGLPFIPPVLREGAGELAWAKAGCLPRLVTSDDVLGSLHVHTTYSDGASNLEEMAAAAIKLGYTYLGLGDHSQTAIYAGGLTPERVKEQWQEIDSYNHSQDRLRLLKGIELEILPDGSLDYDDELLSGFDYIVASVHSSLKQPQDVMMQRLKTALAHPAVTMLGHPTNRLLLGRGESAIDMEQLVDLCARYGKVLELNANPHRLDLDWRWCRLAKQAGVKIAINTDAHRVSGLNDIAFGLMIAQKAGLSKEDIYHI